MLTGCATITRGTTNQLQVTSIPEGANVKLSLGQTCTTPCTLTVSRKDEFQVLFTKQGYIDQTMQVRTQIAGTGAVGFAGNVLVGGFVGMGVDAITGSTLEHVPNPVTAVLVPIAPEPTVPVRKKAGTNKKAGV